MGPLARTQLTNEATELEDRGSIPHKRMVRLARTQLAAFGASAAGIGSAQDPMNASTCSTAEASPGVPTDVSLDTSCGTGPSTASESFSASDSSGASGASGGPSGSTCLGANASAGTSPTTDLTSSCTAQGGATASTTSSNQGANAAQSRAATNGSSAGSAREAAGVLGIEGLPSTATEPASVALLGTALSVAGLALLRRSRRNN